jgi:hypothetical protein
VGNLRFSDGVQFDTSGDLRIESRSDGLYVVGAGMLIPIDSRDEGETIIKEYHDRRLKKEAVER